MRLLVVEDEARLAAYVKRGLEREGYAVDLAGDGERGLLMATTEPYSAIILDIMLPKLNGFRVCAELRAQGNWTPVLMLTAKDGDLDEAEALDTGADDYLRKPFSFAVLLARLRVLLRRDPGRRPAVLEAGDLRLDPASRRCFVGADEVVLTPTEFCLLHLFLRRSGEVISKSDILESCWDWTYEGSDNIVEVYVHHLRSKIDAPYGQARLQTVRGAGYRFDADG